MIGLIIGTLPLCAREIPSKITTRMEKPRYQHSLWGLYVKNSATGEVIYDLNSEKMMLPASTTKMFSVAALLSAYGPDYRFTTPLYAIGDLSNGHFSGQLVLVGQGDWIFGGRDLGDDQIEFTNRDHIIANSIPGVTLTTADPLKGIQSLVLQLRQKGIREISGDVQIDDSLFETVNKRGMILSPIMLNENLIDISLKGTTDGQPASLSWRPQVEGFTVKNEVVTGSKLDVEVTSDVTGQHLIVKGIVPQSQTPIIRTFSVKDPKEFVRQALIQEIRRQGIIFNLKKGSAISSPSGDPIASLTSAPLAEYAKLILKVSHNLGADLIPLLLAAKNKQKTFDEGMLLLGQYVVDKTRVPANAFVFIDGAGGDENRVTPNAEVLLLESQIHNKAFYAGLPILGIDGSLADSAKETSAVGKVRAKTGTGVSYNLSSGKFFSTTHTLAGYVEGKHGQLLEFMVGVNNAESPTIESLFPIAEDLAQIAAEIYEES